MAYYSRQSDNLRAVRDVLPLFAIAIFTVMVYYVLGNWLFTLAGGIAGFLGIEGYVSYVTSRVRSIGVIVGGFFGALIDGYSNFTGSVVAGALSGDLACLVFLMGYITLFGVLIGNYIVSGRFVR
jgi:hypothetical protein